MGLLGGTFDPVHEGHVELAQRALTEYALDEVLFIPAVEPPHKRDERIASYEHRCAMLDRVLAKWPEFRLSRIEKQLPRPSFSLNTIVHLAKQYPQGSSLFFIIGFDSFLDFPNWYRFRQILHYAHLIVANREGLFSSPKQLHELAQTLGYQAGTLHWQAIGDTLDIYFLKGEVRGCSSTGIRTMLQQGCTAHDLGIAESTRDYIIDHKLYDV